MEKSPHLLFTIFAAALNSGFAERISGSMNLPEENPAAFEMCVTWLHIGLLGPKSLPFKIAEVADLDYVLNFDFEEALTGPWKLGDKLVCPAFQDNVT